MRRPASSPRRQPLFGQLAGDPVGLRPLEIRLDRPDGDLDLERRLRFEVPQPQRRLFGLQPGLGGLGPRDDRPERQLEGQAGQASSRT